MTEETSQPSEEVTGPLTESAAAELLQNWNDEPEQQQPQLDSSRVQANAAEEAAEKAAAELAPQEAEPETETAEVDDEGDTDAPSEGDYVHGNARTRLRDGTAVTVGELKKLADEAREFKRRESEFEAQRQEFQNRSAQIAQHEQLFAQTINQAIAALHATLPPEPDATLRESDPIAYFLQKDAYDSKVGEIARLNQAQQAMAGQAAAEQADQFQKYIKQEQARLFEKVPELRNEAKRREFYGDMLSHAKYYDFSEQEINNVHDSRTMRLIKDAIAYRKLQAAKPKVAEKTQNARPVVRPGERVAPTTAVAQKHKALFERARKTRSIDDVGALLAELE
jgi:hypothetical protein